MNVVVPASRARSNVPPGPQSLPPVAMLKRWWDPLRFLRDGAKCGDISCLVTSHLYLINHPAHVQHVLRDRSAIYRKDPRAARQAAAPQTAADRALAAAAAELEPPDHRFVGGQSVALSEGDVWRRQRSLVQPVFNRRALGALAAAVAQETTHLRAKWGDADGRSFDIEQDAITLVLRIWVRALFGDEAGGETERILAAIAATHEFFEARSRSLLRVPRGLPTPSNRRFRRSFESLSEFFFTVIDRRRRDSRQEPDLLGALLQTRDRDTSEHLTRRQLHDELLMLSLLGHKTTATTLAWTLYLLAQTPAVAGRVRQEHEVVLGGRRPDLDDVTKLTYTRQVLEESMRLYPAAWLIGRVASEDDEIGGYHVPAKATVILSPYLLHRHADFWEQPDRFDPERFASGRAAGRPRYVYLPFGEGERACVAGTFAMTQLTLILAELLPYFQFRLVPGQTVKPRISVVLRPGRVPMTVHAHAASAVAQA